MAGVTIARVAHYPLNLFPRPTGVLLDPVRLGTLN